jgi:hypothetical protein
VRRASIQPLLRDIRRAAHTGITGTNAVLASWAAGAGRRLTLAANLSDAACHFPLERGRGLWHEGPTPGETELGPWSVRWTLGD